MYLLNENYISSEKKQPIIYVLGTLLGTFLGMLALIMGLKQVTETRVVNPNFITNKIWILFLGLALFQVFQLFRKSKKT